MGTADTGAGERVGGCPDARDDICYGGTGGYFILVRDAGCVPDHWEDLVWLPTQGGMQTGRAETAEGNEWDVGVTLSVRGDGGGRPAVSEYLRLLQTKHSHTVYCDQDHY